MVDHSRGEYGYTDRKTGTKINTNTVEGYYSIFKRSMKGILPALRREASASISCRVRFSLFKPLCTRLRRYGTRAARPVWRQGEEAPISTGSINEGAISGRSMIGCLRGQAENGQEIRARET